MNTLFATPTSWFILSNVLPTSDLDLIGIIWKIPYRWISEHIYSQLWICPLQIACLYRICNSADVAYVTENLFCTAVSVVSDIISHYLGLFIGGSALNCLFQSLIFLPIDQRLSHGVGYLYMLKIHFLFCWTWPCLSVCPPSSPEPVQWKYLALLYQTHGFPSHLYTGFLEVHMGLWSKHYWCIDEHLNLSYTPPPLKNPKQIIWWIPIKFIW